MSVENTIRTIEDELSKNMRDGDGYTYLEGVYEALNRFPQTRIKREQFNEYIALMKSRGLIEEPKRDKWGYRTRLTDNSKIYQLMSNLKKDERIQGFKERIDNGHLPNMAKSSYNGVVYYPVMRMENNNPVLLVDNDEVYGIPETILTYSEYLKKGKKTQLFDKAEVSAEVLLNGAVISVPTFALKHYLEMQFPQHDRKLSYPVLLGLLGFSAIIANRRIGDMDDNTTTKSIVYGGVAGIILQEIFRFYRKSLEKKIATGKESARAGSVSAGSALRASGVSGGSGGKIVSAPAAIASRLPESVPPTPSLQPRAYFVTSEGINNGSKMMSRNEFLAEVQKNKMSAYPEMFITQADQLGAGLAASLAFELEKMGIQSEISTR